MKKFSNKLKDIINTIKSAGKKDRIVTLVTTVILLFLVLISVFYKSEGIMSVTSSADSIVTLNMDAPYLTQSYQVTDRNITGARINVDTQYCESLSGTMTCTISADSEGQNILTGDEVALGDGIEEYYFDFDKIDVEPGRRIYINVSLITESPDTLLAIKANSEYGGLRVCGQDRYGAIDISLFYDMPGNISGLLRIILVFTALTMLFMIIFDRDFAACIGMAFGSLFIYLFLFGVVGALGFAVNSAYCISMVIAVLIPVLALIKKRPLLSLISPGLIAFWLLVLIYFVLDRNVAVGKIDDLIHWQLAVRDMWYSDSFAYHVGSAVKAPRYTPALATLEYFFTRMYGTYREGIALLGAHTIGFAFMGILFSGVKWKKCHRVLPLMALVSALPLFFFLQYYGTLYADAYLGIIGAYLFICYFTEKYSPFNVIRMIIASILLVLVKEMGLVVVFTFYLTVLVDLIIQNKGIKKLFKNNKTAVKYLLAAVASVGAFIVWEIYVKVGSVRLARVSGYNAPWTILETIKHGIQAVFGSACITVPKPVEGLAQASAGMSDFAGVKVTSGFLAMAATGTSLGVKQFSGVTVIKTLFAWMAESGMYFGRSFLTVMGIMLAVFVLIAYTGIFKKLNIKIKICMSMLVIGMCIYQFALLLSYLFIFYEGDPISAQERYIASYMLLILITLIGLLIVPLNNREITEDRSSVAIWLIAFVVFVIVPKDGHFFTTEENFGIYYTTWQIHKNIGEASRTFADKAEKIYYISYEDSQVNIYENYMTFHNAIVPTLDQSELRWKLVADENQTQYAGFVHACSPDALANILTGYDYVYVRDFEDYFVQNYGLMFEDASQIVSGGFYKVLPQPDGTVTLRKIARKDIH